MKALLARFTPHKGIGLYVDEHEIVVSRVASTPLGLVELSCQRESYATDEREDVIARLLEPLVGSQKRRPPIAVGISARRVFFSTRPIRADSTSTSPQALLREVLQSPNVCIDEMTVEVTKGEFAKRKLASVASCRKEFLGDLLQTLQACGVQPYRTEPAPLALLRVGRHRRRTRRGKPALRLFLGEGEALAVATAGPLCVFWKSFKLAAGGEATALAAAIRSCQSLIHHCGIDVPLDVVIVHGREDLRGELTGDEFVEKAGVPVVCCDGPKLDGAAVAYGLALACLTQEPGETLDLLHSVMPSPSLWQIFPWGEVAVQVALILCMGLFMLSRASSAEKAVAPVQAELDKHAWVSHKQQADLQKEKQDLTVKVDAVRKFAVGRIMWTKYTYDISTRLPANATLTAFMGICELEDSGKSKAKPKKSFLVRATATVEPDGSTPKEIDRFLTALRGHPLLQKDFPLVELADIKSTQPIKGQPRTALFTVLCLPKPKGAAASSGASKGGHK